MQEALARLADALRAAAVAIVEAGKAYVETARAVAQTGSTGSAVSGGVTFTVPPFTVSPAGTGAVEEQPAAPEAANPTQQDIIPPAPVEPSGPPADEAVSAPADQAPADTPAPAAPEPPPTEGL